MHALEAPTQCTMYLNFSFLFNLLICFWNGFNFWFKGCFYFGFSFVFLLIRSEFFKTCDIEIWKKWHSAPNTFSCWPLLYLTLGHWNKGSSVSICLFTQYKPEKSMRCINNQFLFYVVCKLLRLFTTSRLFFIRHSDDQNVLWNCLYWSIWSDITIAQWLKYRACNPQIPSSNPPWAFVHTYWIKFSKITSSSQIAYFFTCLFCILFWHRAIFHNQNVFLLIWEII